MCFLSSLIVDLQFTCQWYRQEGFKRTDYGEILYQIDCFVVIVHIMSVTLPLVHLHFDFTIDSSSNTYCTQKETSKSGFWSPILNSLLEFLQEINMYLKNSLQVGEDVVYCLSRNGFVFYEWLHKHLLII